MTWGLLFAIVATGALWLLGDDGRRSDVADRVPSLTLVTIGTIAILAVGLLLLVAGATGLLRRTQRRTAAGTAAEPASDIVTT